MSNKLTVEQIKDRLFEVESRYSGISGPQGPVSLHPRPHAPIEEGAIDRPDPDEQGRTH